MNHDEISQARARILVGADAKKVRQTSEPDEPHMRVKMREVAKQRRQFF